MTLLVPRCLPSFSGSLQHHMQLGPSVQLRDTERTLAVHLAWISPLEDHVQSSPTDTLHSTSVLGHSGDALLGHS